MIVGRQPLVAKMQPPYITEDVGNRAEIIMAHELLLVAFSPKPLWDATVHVSEYDV